MNLAEAIHKTNYTCLNCGHIHAPSDSKGLCEADLDDSFAPPTCSCTDYKTRKKIQ